jgi:ribosomal protein S8
MMKILILLFFLCPSLCFSGFFSDWLQKDSSKKQEKSSVELKVFASKACSVCDKKVTENEGVDVYTALLAHLKDKHPDQWHIVWEKEIEKK